MTWCTNLLLGVPGSCQCLDHPCQCVWQKEGGARVQWGFPQLTLALMLFHLWSHGHWRGPSNRQACQSCSSCWQTCQSSWQAWQSSRQTSHSFHTNVCRQAGPDARQTRERGRTRTEPERDQLQTDSASWEQRGLRLGRTYSVVYDVLFTYTCISLIAAIVSCVIANSPCCSAVQWWWSADCLLLVYSFITFS